MFEKNEVNEYMTTQVNNWEEALYNLVNQSLTPQKILFSSTTQNLPFNREQRRAVNALANPIYQVPQTIRQPETTRVTNIPPEQILTFADPGTHYHTSRKVVASTLVIGPPGTGKTHVICSASILRVINPDNLDRARRQNGRPERVFLATFSNAGSYRIYEKFHEIATLANAMEYHERIKLVQSNYARNSYAFQTLQQRIGLNPEDFTIPNIISNNDRREFLREILIFVGTTDSLGILTTNAGSSFSHGVIYDEASQLTVPQFFQVIPIHNMQSVCIVGDDKQLTPVITLAPLGVSALSYLQGMNTYQNIPIPDARRIKLQRQYRMHPAIAQLTERILPIRRIVIPDGPTTAPDYLLPISQYNPSNLPNLLTRSTFNDLDNILRPEHPLIIIDTSDISGALDEQVGQSRRNVREGEIAIGIHNAIKLVYQVLSNDDIILTSPYRPQIKLFQQHNVRTGTVHQYQGQEADVVIYSLTFAQPNTKSDFFSQFNLMYVGLSRARKKLIVIGNQEAMNHPDRAIQSVRNTIFHFRYNSGGRGYPNYTIDPVSKIKPNDLFLSDINNYLI